MQKHENGARAVVLVVQDQNRAHGDANGIDSCQVEGVGVEVRDNYRTAV